MSACFVLVASIAAAAKAQELGGQSIDITLGGDAAAPSEAPSETPSEAPSPAGPRGALPGRLSPPDFNHLYVQAIGTVNEDGAQIERRAGGSGVQILFTCSRGQALGVAGQIGDWYCILMADRTLGCIPVGRVTLTWDRPAPDPGDTAPRTLTPVIFPDDHSGSASPTGLRIVDEAMQYLGVHYLWGGNGFNGIDCSGLVKNVFRAAGIDLPRTAREQASVGIPVSLAEVQPGDRLSFACHGSAIDHTGIYIGHGQFIHASGAHQQVCIGKLEGSYLKWLVAVHRDQR